VVPLLLIMACGGDAQPIARPHPITTDAGARRPAAATVLWRRQPIDGAGLSIDVIEGVPLDGGAAPGGGRYLRQRHDVVQLYVAWNRDVEADHRALRRHSPGATETETMVPVCEASARRIDTHVPAAGSRAGAARDGNPVRVKGPDAALDRIELLFEHDGVPVRMMYTVQSRYRDLRRGDEQHFLGSIECRPTPPRRRTPPRSTSPGAANRR
jgi:hypothetical protein